MKMKTGPKVLMLAILFVGLGFWAGRGFPKTWEAFTNPGAAPVAVQTDTGESGAINDRGGSITSRRVNELEDRVAELEKTVNALRTPAPPAPSYPAVPADPAGPAPSAPATPPAGTPFPTEVPEGSL